MCSCCFGCCYYLLAPETQRRENKPKTLNPGCKKRRASITFLCFPSFFFFFFALLLLLLLLLLLHLTHNPLQRKLAKGDHLEEHKNPLLAGESAAPTPRHRVLIGARQGARESEPQKAENATSFCGCVIEPPKRPQLSGPSSSSFSHFALRFRRFRDIAEKRGLK